MGMMYKVFYIVSAYQDHSLDFGSRGCSRSLCALLVNRYHLLVLYGGCCSTYSSPNAVFILTVLSPTKDTPGSR